MYVCWARLVSSDVGRRKLSAFGYIYERQWQLKLNTALALYYD